MNTFPLKIYASNHIVFEGECESLVVPITNGQFGVMANHENVVCAVTPGMLMYREPGGENHYASISDGIMFGVIAYTVINACAGHFKRIHWIMYVLTALFIAKYALM